MMRDIQQPEIEKRHRIVTGITDGCHASAVSAPVDFHDGKPAPMTKTICNVTRSTDGQRSNGAGDMNAAEIRIAKLVPLLSLAILLTAAALAWSLRARNAAVAAADPDLLSTSAPGLAIQTKSAAAQTVKDSTAEFSGAQLR